MPKFRYIRRIQYSDFKSHVFDRNEDGKLEQLRPVQEWSDGGRVAWWEIAESGESREVLDNEPLFTELENDFIERIIGIQLYV
jgi:hypothetical protein